MPVDVSMYAPQPQVDPLDVMSKMQNYNTGMQQNKLLQGQQQLQQQQITKGQMDIYQNRLAVVGQRLGALWGETGGQPTRDDVMKHLTQASIDEPSIFTKEMVANEIGSLPSDADVAKNPNAIKAWTIGHISKTDAAMQQLQKLQPQPSFVNYGSGSVAVDTNPNTNNGLIGTRVQPGLTPSEATATTRTGTDASGLPIIGTKNQLLEKQYGGNPNGWTGGPAPGTVTPGPGAALGQNAGSSAPSAPVRLPSGDYIGRTAAGGMALIDGKTGQPKQGTQPSAMPAPINAAPQGGQQNLAPIDPNTGKPQPIAVGANVPAWQQPMGQSALPGSASAPNIPPPGPAPIPSPAPAPAPVAGNGYHPGQGVVVDAPLGTNEAAQGQAKAGTDQLNTLRAATEGAPQRKGMLNNLEDDLQKFTPGPLSEGLNKGKAIANELGSHVGVQPFDPNAIAAQENFRKQATQLAQQQFSALGGTGTDSQLSSAFKSNPSEYLSKLGNQRIIQMLKGNEDALAAKSTAANQWVQDHGPNSYPQFIQDWNKNFEPRAFQFVYMNGSERKELFANMTPSERTQVQAKIVDAENRGWIKAPTAGN